jgi:MoaA/NifB/PqqE/SkfB family radical SAM enzyme
MSARRPMRESSGDAALLAAHELRSNASHIPRRKVEMPVLPPTDEAQPWVGPNGQIMRRLELHLTYHCPERCIFCSEEHRMEAFHPFDVTWARVATVLRTHASRGVQAVHLTGGEPTLHPQFVEVCMLARKLGMRTSVGTIGTMLAKPAFAQKAVPWLDEALFSIHGPNAEIHDALTRRAGSFDTVTRALRNALEVRPGFGAFVNTVVTRLNVDHLGDTVELAASLGAKLIVISNTTPEGGGLDHFDQIELPLTKLAAVMPTLPARAGDAIVRFFGMPMCLLAPHESLSNDVHWDPRVTVEWGREPGKVVFRDFYNWEPNRKRVHVAACQGCTRRGVCMGVYDTYAERYETPELRPYTETR